MSAAPWYAGVIEIFAGVDHSETFHHTTGPYVQHAREEDDIRKAEVLKGYTKHAFAASVAKPRPQ